MGLGLGTWQNTDPEKCREAVKYALNHGYTHLDTAQIYRNEEHVGKGIKDSNKSREEVFLASKVWNTKLGKRDVLSSTKESLEKLNVESIDLMYIHWPSTEYRPEKTLEGFQALKDRGLIKHIGVSNFGIEQLEKALQYADIYANQVEMHPLLPQEELLEFCEENNIELVAYSPLARGKVFEVPEIQEVAEKHGVSEAQVSLSWIIEKGATPIPKSQTQEHIKDNLKALELELDQEDIQKIDSINETVRTVDPEFAPWN